MPIPTDSFVVDGAERFKETQLYKAAVAAIEKDVSTAFEDRILAAGPLRRFILKAARRREIRRRVQMLTPDQALYLGCR